MAVHRSRSLGTRLAHLEARVPTPSIEANGPRTEDEWLAAFELLGRDGFFVPEPEFPGAIAPFRDALAAALASTDPPFDPPAEFEPNHPSPYQRRLNWRTGGRFPAVNAAFAWLGEIVHGIDAGIPPVRRTDSNRATTTSGFSNSAETLVRCDAPEAAGGALPLIDGGRAFLQGEPFRHFIELVVARPVGVDVEQPAKVFEVYADVGDLDPGSRTRSGLRSPA